jgi:caffeoyl-CoA O-methyltransferase
MTPKSALLSPELQDYLVSHGLPPDEVQRDLIAETAALGGSSSMQISPEQGGFMTLLTKLVGVRNAVEVGTFTGYSSLAVARGMAPDGRLLCCDIDKEWTSVARRYWERAGVADRIELRLAPALDTLRELPADAALDFSFIDADKEGYIGYWEELVPRTRPGGVILVDNVLWNGEVVDADATSAGTQAIRAFNDHASADDRVELVMLPIADGLTLARKK